MGEPRERTMCQRDGLQTSLFFLVERKLKTVFLFRSLFLFAIGCDFEKNQAELDLVSNCMTSEKSQS